MTPFTNLQVPVERKRMCEDCKGKGMREGAKAAACDSCGGAGAGYARTPFGMMQMECQECSGTGKAISARDKCRGCDGEKIATQRTMLDVMVPRGSATHKPIVLAAQGHCIPGV